MTMIIDGTNGLTFNNSTTQASAGQVLQVVNATYATIVNTNSATLVNTGLTASITPKFVTSKILILVNHNGCYNNATASDVGMRIVLLRNSTQILGIEGLGPYVGNYVSQGTFSGGGINTTYLDSPATTSSITYLTQFGNRGVGATGVVGINLGGATSSTSTITLMEIAA